MNERETTRRDFLKILGAAAIATAVGVTVVRDTLGNPPSEPLDYSKLDFRPVETYAPVLESPAPPPSAEQALSPDEQKIQNIQRQADKVLSIAKKSGKFTDNSLDDLHDNLPFYLGAGKEHGIDWVVLWVIHERESGASDPNSAAFDPKNANRRVQGSWQIDIGWDREDFDTDPFDGLGYLESFPQRHDGDAIGAAYAANMIRRNLDEYKDQGYETALFKAMSIYCGQTYPAERKIGSKDEVNIRLDKIYKYRKIFSDQIKGDIQNRNGLRD